MSGGTIDGNTASGSVSTSFYGGGVYISGGTNSGTFTMIGGTISNNTAHEGGGVYNGGAFIMNSGTISGNSASGSNSGSGGGVYTGTHMGGTFTMYGGTIGGNTASGTGTDSGGGGVYASRSFTMEDGIISGNTANRGGGVYVYGTGTTFTKAAGIIYGSNTTDTSLRNTATNGGAGNAVYVSSGSRSSRRNTTAGIDVFLDSGISGASGGWE
jgi:hypothetical protein